MELQELECVNEFKVYTCETSVPDIVPQITAQKLFYNTEGWNLTEMELIKSAVSDAGVTAELFWFHEKGYFEEFLGGKSGMLHPACC